ncbi:MAG: class I SAM-dependent methyltransferase [Gemmatimonadota bacterium]
MGDYETAADFYDLLYAGEKDYAAEAAWLAECIRERQPAARSLLDVACGTGEHAKHLAAMGFRVDGVDLEPAFVARAAAKLPAGRFQVADMEHLDLDERYDVVTCLFSSIGYACTVERLNRTVAALARHLAPAGVLIVDPWFEPGQLTHGFVMTVLGADEQAKVCRMSRTVVDGRLSVLEFEYLIGRAGGIERASERHTLGLFTEAEMGSAFAAAGLRVERLPEALRTRGIYVGRPAD